MLTAPDRPGYYWARLVRPQGTPAGEDWRSVDWEIVHVVVNIFGVDAAHFGRFGVFVPGVGSMQHVQALAWGPRILEAPPFAAP